MFHTYILSNRLYYMYVFTNAYIYVCFGKVVGCYIVVVTFIAKVCVWYVYRYVFVCYVCTAIIKKNNDEKEEKIK